LDDLTIELNNYLLARQQVVDGTASVEPKALLLRESDQPFTVKVASEVIRRLLRQEGVKPAKGRVGPSPYEFRHAFAVHRLTAWYHQGLDIHAQLPLLSAYMGHNNVLGTPVYLAATPELMSLASQRFAEHYHRAAKE
jgi:integrase/recombinase XerD